jgi:hypothetical protein
MAEEICPVCNKSVGWLTRYKHPDGVNIHQRCNYKYESQKKASAAIKEGAKDGKAPVNPMLATTSDPASAKAGPVATTSDPAPAKAVLLTDIDLPFGSLVELCFKWSFAVVIGSLPLALLLFIIFQLIN